MKKIIFGCRFVSFLMLLTLILHYRISVVPFQLVFQQPEVFNEWKSSLVYLMITGVLFVILNLIAAVGLFAVKKWGFIVGYLAIISSTLAGISYIPFYKSLYKFFLSQPSIIPLILSNIVILSYVI